jgi:iron complex transport system substrate-binding protein
MPRILSLIPSSTEIVCALGFGNQLIGRSHECDFPSSVQKLSSCTAPKFKVEGTSAEIDQRVKSILKNALSVYQIDEKKLQQMQPDIIITQAQCEVCAVSLKDVEKAVCEWVESHPQIVSLEPNKLSDIWKDFINIAEALGVKEQGHELVYQLKQRMNKIAQKTINLPQKPTVVCIEWIEPLMSAGNWMPELIEMGGGINLFGVAGEHSPWMTWEQLLEANPDVILVMPCGFNLSRSKAEMSLLSQKPEWSQLNAVQNQQVYLTDGNQYFNRPGPRLVESLEIIAEILHPAHFDFHHQQSGWEQL